MVSTRYMIVGQHQKLGSWSTQKIEQLADTRNRVVGQHKKHVGKRKNMLGLVYCHERLNIELRFHYPVLVLFFKG